MINILCEHRRRVGDLSLFYRQFNNKCSTETTTLISLKGKIRRNNRLVLNSHQWTMKFQTSRTSLNQNPLNTGHHLRGTSYNLQMFKSRFVLHLTVGGAERSGSVIFKKLIIKLQRDFRQEIHFPHLYVDLMSKNVEPRKSKVICTLK